MLTDYKAAGAAKPSDEAVPAGNLPPVKVFDHVTFSDVHGQKHRGFVRWIGTDKSALPDGSAIVGIETVSVHVCYTHTQLQLCHINTLFYIHIHTVSLQ